MKRLSSLFRSKAKILTSILALAFITALSSVNSFSATYYIAPPAGGPGGSGTISDPWHDLNYALNKYANDGVQARVRPGDTLYLRGGVYDISKMTTNGSTYMAPVINLGSTNVNSPTTTIMSYPGEWAILDGYKTSRALYGYPGVKQYNIVFQNFEVRNGLTVGMIFGNGWDNVFLVNSVFRNIYFHDNTDANYNNNPAGLELSGDNCIVEYCTFENNGTPGSNHLNSANLILYNSYNGSNNGSVSLGIDIYPRKNNIIRYNSFIGSAASIKDKGEGNFVDMRPGHNPLTERHPEWYNEIHNNIISGAANSGYYLHQDFVKVHNNIFLNCAEGIKYDSVRDSSACSAGTAALIWEAQIYNNTFKSSTGHDIDIEPASTSCSGLSPNYGYNFSIYNNLYINPSDTPYSIFSSDGGSSLTWPMAEDHCGTSSLTGKNVAYYQGAYRTLYQFQDIINPSLGTKTLGTNSIYNALTVNSDFSLPAGSAAIGAGRSGTDLGAVPFGTTSWYSQVGYKQLSNSNLAAPTNLMVIYNNY